MKPLIITGITGSGKSTLAVNYAKSFNDKACVINADASQLYNELKILTAYPEQNDIKAVSHKLFGILSFLGITKHNLPVLILFKSILLLRYFNILIMLITITKKLRFDIIYQAFNN